MAGLPQVSAMFLLPLLVEAANPLVPHQGMADPHVHVWGGEFYMYSTHDTRQGPLGNSTCCQVTARR